MLKFSNKLWTILSALVVIGLNYGSAIEQPEHPFQVASNQFAVNLWQKLSQENSQKSEPENLFFSPYSIATALSMVYVGSNGVTKTQLASAMSLAKGQLENKQTLTEQCQISSERMFGQLSHSSESTYTLKGANGMALNKDFKVIDSYRKMIQKQFSGEVFTITDGKQATQLINQWISDKTNHKIDKFLQKPLSENTAMVLLNAVYFMGKWKNQFDPSLNQPDTFHGLNGKQYSNVVFMTKSYDFNVARSNGMTMVELPYRGNDVSMYAFLPDKAEHFGTMKQSLSSTKTIDEMIQKKKSSYISLSLPKLKMDNQFDLVPALKSMGVQDLFDGRANLSGITGIAAGSIAVSSVKHMARVDMNELGTEAAAATVIEMVYMSGYVPEFVEFNRPFVFVIRHNKNGQLLFVGEVVKF